jgi:hypothetical protein
VTLSWRNVPAPTWIVQIRGISDPFIMMVTRPIEFVPDWYIASILTINRSVIARYSAKMRPGQASVATVGIE